MTEGIQSDQLKGTELEFSQTVVRQGVPINQFDIILRFQNNTDQPEIWTDELVKEVLQAYIKQFGEIIVKINWWSKDLMVIAPHVDKEESNETV